MFDDGEPTAWMRGDRPGRGAQRAAAVLLGLGPEVAAGVFRLLDEEAIRQIALGARELRKSPEDVPRALAAFVEAMDGIGGDAVAGEGLLREMAERALGQEVVRRAFDGAQTPVLADEALGAVANADPEDLATLLVREQAQTAALVLGALDPDRASAVINRIPEVRRPEILRRLAALEAVDPGVLRAVGAALSQELDQSVALGIRRVDGKAAAAALLRRCPALQQSEVVAEIERDDPDLAADLRNMLFTFEDLAHLSDRDLQTLIREIDMGQLALALKGASPAVKQKVLKNMSLRAGQMLSDDINVLGPVRLSTVEGTRTELVKIAFWLAEQGRITLVGAADRMV